MKITLTLEATGGELSYVEAEGETYEEAKDAAEALIPESSKAIVLRTS